MLAAPDQEVPELFRVIERDFRSAGYLSSRGRKEDSEGQITDFFSKDGSPRLYVRASLVPDPDIPGVPTAQIWISWSVSTR